MSACDPDECLYADGHTPEGCDRKVCSEHDPDEVVYWNDGVDSGWLHARGSCNECDRCWQDVEVNTAWYAALPASDPPASVSPEQTPSPADDSSHSGDQCTVPEATP